MSKITDPALLIALARWALYREQPTDEVRQRLQDSYQVTTVYAGFGDDLQPMGPAIFDLELRAQVSEIPEMDAWFMREFSNIDAGDDWISPSKETRVYHQLLHEIRNDETYLVVATGTTPTDAGDGFTVQLTRDDAPLPYGLELARQLS